MDMHILDLPNDLISELFDYLTYDEVSQCREVCRKFDEIGQQKLNSGFAKAIKKHSISYRRIKLLLPRRESERRNHALARHADILSSVETRISMLSMTYGKYIETKSCCFIPGRILDEIFRILKCVSYTHILLRPHEVLQELRDLSSMAMEHFDERVANGLKIAKSAAKPPAIAGNNNYSLVAAGTGICSNLTHMINSDILRATEMDSANVSIHGCGLDQQTAGTAASTVSASTSSSHNVDPQFWNVLFTTAISTPNNCQHCRGTVREQIRGALEAGQTCMLEGINRYTAGRTNDNTGGGDGQADATTDATTDAAAATMPVSENQSPLLALYEDGLRRVNRMRHRQKVMARDLHNALSTINDISAQFVDMRRRFEDLDAKNRELTQRLNHIGSEDTPPSPTTAALPNMEMAASIGDVCVGAELSRKRDVPQYDDDDDEHADDDAAAPCTKKTCN